MFLETLSSKFQKSEDDELFARVFQSGCSTLELRRPEPSEYGMFVALAEAIQKRVLVADRGDYLELRPRVLSNWPDYRVLSLCAFKFHTPSGISSKLALCQQYRWCRSVPSHDQVIAVSSQRIHRLGESTAFRESRAQNDFYPEENTEWVSLSGAFTQELFNDPLINFAADLFVARKELLRREMTEVVKDFATLETFILHSENDNFIDIKCDLTIESPELRLWMSYLGEAHHDLGVRILNRVMAVCLFGSGVAYAVKRNEQDLTGPLRPVIDYWSKDSLANALRTFHYEKSSEEVSGETQSAEPSRKKRKLNREYKVYWFNIWLEHKDRAQVRQIIYAPWSIKEPYVQAELASADYVVTRTLNTFYGYPKSFDDCKQAYLSDHGRRCIVLWRQLVEEVICNTRRDCFEYFHNWFAFAVQRPLEKTKVAIIMKSQQGVGKGFISQVLNRWYGSNFKALSGTSPDQKFNSFLVNKKVVWIDEMAAVFRDMNVMNSLVTEPFISIERKGIDQTTEVNLANFIGGTNNTPRLPLTTDSRRWCLLSAKPMLDKELVAWRETMRETWTAILEHPEFEDTGAWAILYWYMTRDVSEFIPMFNIPETDDLINCMEYALNQVEAWWRLVLENKVLNPNILAGEKLEIAVYTWQELYNICNDPKEDRTVTGQKKRAMTLHDFKNKLEKVAVYNQEENKIRFRPWPEQYRRWYEIYPKMKIYNMDIRDLEPNPFTVQLLERVKHASIPDIVKGYSHQEKDYLIERLIAKLGRENVTLNESLLKRTDKTDNKDLVEF